MKHSFEVSGKDITDKYTHYEFYPYLGPERVTIRIRGDTVEKFKKRYNLPIAFAEKLVLRVDLGRNAEMIPECRELFKPNSALVCSVETLEDIDYSPRK